MPISIPINLNPIVGIPATIDVTLEIELDSKFRFNGFLDSNWNFGAGKAVHLTAVLDEERIKHIGENGSGFLESAEHLLRETLSFHVETFDIRDVPVIGWMGASLKHVLSAEDYTNKIRDLDIMMHEMESDQKRRERVVKDARYKTHKKGNQHDKDQKIQLLKEKELYVKYKFCEPFSKVLAKSLLILYDIRYMCTSPYT